MTDVKDFTPNTVYMAIDIAKYAHDVIIKWSDNKKKQLKIPNTLVGYEKLLDLTKDSQKIIAGFEATADYHRNIAYWLNNHGITCMLVSSVASARARDMLFNSWDKNDRKDANIILYLLEQGMGKNFHDPLVNEILDIQELSNTYHQISLARSRCYHSLLNHYLALYFPEIERFHHSSRSEWLCNILLKFPTPHAITKMCKQTFVKQAWNIVGRKVNK